MDELQRQRIVNKHRDSLTRHGHSPHALYWSSREIQEKRFEVLAEVGIASGESVLDVGCGFGDLYHWLAVHGVQVNMTGVDLSPDLLARGRQLYPDMDFLCGELFDFDWPEQSFDWVVLSGALNGQLGDEGAYARRVIRRMFELCRKGVAFNLLNAQHEGLMFAYDLALFDPDEVLVFCQQITPDCTCRADYLANDFTIYMRRADDTV